VADPESKPKRRWYKDGEPRPRVGRPNLPPEERKPWYDPEERRQAYLRQKERKGRWWLKPPRVRPPKKPPGPRKPREYVYAEARAALLRRMMRDNAIPPATFDVADPRFNVPCPPLDDVYIPMAVRIPVHASRLRPNTGERPVKEMPPFVAQLLEDLSRFSCDPLGFVMWAFPWGEPNTPLESMTGPEQWQREQLERIGKRLVEGGPAGCVIEEDVSSGHGIGKSAMVSWMILWAVSTFEDTRGVVTANTDSQLRTKTWAELAKWYEMFLGKSLFTLTATSIYLAGDKVREKKWRIDQAPWSKENTEAFAGMHNMGKRILVVFDEAAAIDDHIYEVTEGALTDANTQILWLRYGNPTRTSGRFFNNCTRGKRNTYTRVDSRTVSFSNKAQIQAWVDDYGEDSDFVRVRVKGQFPRAGYSNFISPEIAQAAARRRLDPVTYRAFPKVLSVDPARFGDDMSVITLRQGLRVYWQMGLSGFDGPDLASRIFEIVRKQGQDSQVKVEAGAISCIVYDAIGNGADLDSSLRRMPGLPPLVAVQWGQPAKDSKQYFNQRSECWGTMRDWLAHGQIPDDSQKEDGLVNQLTTLDYGYSATFQIQLQSKKDLKKNGGKSPDYADSLALSFVPELIDRKIVLAKVRPVERRKVVWTR
jgi:hypothetical protein